MALSFATKTISLVLLEPLRRISSGDGTYLESPSLAFILIEIGTAQRL